MSPTPPACGDDENAKPAPSSGDAADSQGSGTPDDAGFGDARDLRLAFRRSEQVVDAFVAAGRQRRALDAREIRLLARADALIGETAAAASGRASAREIARRSMIAELATAAHLSEWTVARLLGESADLCDRFGAGVDALERAEISRQHLLVIYEAGITIVDDQARAAYLALALDAARELPHGRLRAVVRRFAEPFLDRTLSERTADAHTRRRVEVTDLADGLSQLLAIIPTTLAHGIDDRLTAQANTIIDARPDEAEAAGESAVLCGDDAQPDDSEQADTGDSARADAVIAADTDPARDTTDPTVESATDPTDEHGTDHDTRTLDQVRADVFTDLLLTGTPDTCLGGDGLGEIHATVQVTIPVLTMTGHSDEPCILAGYGPIDPDTARELAADAVGWERVMTSPLTGGILAVDRYRSSADLKRFLRARDEHCRFPGCRRPVWRCDIDPPHPLLHPPLRDGRSLGGRGPKDAALGGPTCHDNTAHLCRRHHTLKHESAWSVEQVSPGVLVWTSPTGRRHTDRPEPEIRFIPDNELLPRRRRLEDYALLHHDGTAPF